MAKKITTLEEFDALSQDEQNECLDEIKDKLGDAVIDMKMYVPSEVKEWWEKKCKDDAGGKLSIEMLMSNFLIASLSIAINEGEQAFLNKTAIAQLVLLRPLTERNGKIYIGGDGTRDGSIDKDEHECECGNCDDKGGNDDGSGQTYH